MRYVKYAAGEILLVVIGILIALQIDSWNDDRLDRQQERDYLASMQVDLASDMSAIDRAMQGNGVLLDALDDLLELIAGPIDDPASQRRLFIYSAAYTYWFMELQFAELTMTQVWGDVADVDGNGEGTYGEATLARPFSVMAPFISGRVDDNQLESKRLEFLRLAGADGANSIQLRFAQSGTASWYWGVDEIRVVSMTGVATEPPVITSITPDGSGNVVIEWTGDAPAFHHRGAERQRVNP